MVHGSSVFLGSSRTEAQGPGSGSAGSRTNAWHPLESIKRKWVLCDMFHCSSVFLGSPRTEAQGPWVGQCWEQDERVAPPLESIGFLCPGIMGYHQYSSQSNKQGSPYENARYSSLSHQHSHSAQNCVPCQRVIAVSSLGTSACAVLLAQ
jgi:hypothetical protein